MKKIIIALLLAALGFFSLVIYQNMAYLLTPAKLQMNFWVTDPFYSERIINAQLILGAFFAGLLISYSGGLSFRFKTTQTIKGLQEKLNSQVETITALKSELSKYQGTAPQQEPPQPETSIEST